MSLEATAAALRCRPDLHTEKLVLISLADHHNRSTGRCFPKVATIMRDAMVSRATAFRCLSSLEKQGLIKRHPNFGANGRQSYSSYELLFVGSQIETGEGANSETPINRNKEQGKKEAQSKPIDPSSPSADAIFSDSTVRNSTDLDGVKGVVSGKRKRSARSAAIPAPDPKGARPSVMKLAKTLSRLDEHINGAGRGAMRFDLRLHDGCLELQGLCDKFGQANVKAAVAHWLRALMTGEGIHRPGRIVTWEFFRPVTVAWVKAEKIVGSPVFHC
jgi:hypothetical protein